MTSKIKDKLSLLWQKIKNIKHIEIYIALILAVIIGGVYFIKISKNDSHAKDTTTNDTNITNFSSSQEYATFLENKLENVLKEIQGAKDVDVMLTIEKGFEYVYLTEEETRTTSNGTQITSTNVVLIDGKPVIVQEVYPTVKGMLVLVKGANDVSTRLNIISAIQTVIDIDASKINILSAS